MGNKISESWTKESLSVSLKRLLKESGHTMADMSRTLGISFTTISDWVNGRKYPRPENLDRLANYFGVTTSMLLNLDDPELHPAVSYLGSDIVLPLLARGYTIDLQFDSSDLDFGDLANPPIQVDEKYLITDSRTMEGVVLTGDEIRALGKDVDAVVGLISKNKKAPDTLIDVESLSEDKRYLIETIISLPDDKVRSLRTIVAQVLVLRGD